MVFAFSAKPMSRSALAGTSDALSRHIRSLRDRSSNRMRGSWTVNREPDLDAAGDADLAADRLDQVLDDRQAQPGPAQLAAPRLVDPVEPLEDARQVVAGMPMPVSATSSRLHRDRASSDTGPSPPPGCT